MSALLAYRDRMDLTLDEVVDAADHLLREIAPRQTRWAVTEKPDVRTVRYYTSRGLLQKPTGYEGGRARYGYGHLVRLLAIKRMQAEHMTLEQIARVLAKTDDDALAVLVETGEAATVTADVAVAPPAPVVVAPAAPATAPATAPAPASALAIDDAVALVLEHLVLSADTIADPAKRARLADNLENLVRMLRATNGAKDA